MAKIDNVITTMFHFSEQSTAPDTPSSGVVVIYAKNDGKMYEKDDTGTEVCLNPQDLSTYVQLSTGAVPPSAVQLSTGAVPPSAVQLSTGAVPPSADVSHHKELYLIEGGTGVADILKVCVKKADDTYDWLTVGLT